MAWIQNNIVYLALALLLGWIFWQRLVAPKMAGVKTISAGDYLRMRHDDHVLIDVRSDAEWRAGHAPAARHIPLGSISQRMAQIPQDRPVVVLCASGNRSAMAAVTLAKNGFGPVYNFTGGMGAWQAAGLPVKAGR